MKTLVLMRHGRAEAFSDRESDLGRRLLKSGVADTILIGKRLLDSGFSPDLIISSMAKRTQETAQLMASSLHYDLGKLVVNQQMFEAFEEDLLQMIRELPDEINSVLVVGHNPSISIVGYKLSSTAPFEFPTSAALWLSFNGASWQTARKESVVYSHFYHPDNS